MPIHDWTRVRANRFHDFHQRWMIAISDVLNDGRLPPGFFALVEQITGGPEPDVVTLELPDSGPPAGDAFAILPPKASVVKRVEPIRYARKANRVAIHHPDGDVVAVIEIVSPGNKSSRDALRSLVRKAVALLTAGVHLLLVDLFPPSKRDPQGVHKAIWDRFDEDEPFALPPGKPLTLVSYAVAGAITAYIEPVAIGDALPNMPVFLTGAYHVACPLEESYRAAWEKFPPAVRGPLE